MSWFSWKTLVLVALISYGLKLYMYETPRAVHLQGTVDPKFEKVREAFRLNLVEGWERGGGAFVVYKDGKKVVDIYGGYADTESERLWKQDTMNVAFSCTKAVAALCVAQLVDRGRLSYDDLVTKHWPEFGQGGKQNITVRWMLSHQAGLAYTDEAIDLATAMDHRAVSKMFEKQVPVWPAGTAVGYHAVTFGWLVDQLIRRTDEKGRSVGQYFKEEMADKYNLEFHIGLPLDKVHRVSRLKTPSFRNFLAEYAHSPSDFNIRRFIHQMMFGGHLSRVANNVPWIAFVSEMTLNNPDMFSLEQAAVLGIGTPGALAMLFEKLRSGELLSKDAFAQLTENYVHSVDVVTGANVPRGQGLMVKQLKRGDKMINLLGHSGYGGQNVRIDVEHGLTFVYMSNHLKVGFGDTSRTYVRLLNTLYDCLLDQ